MLIVPRSNRAFSLSPAVAARFLYRGNADT